MSYAPTMATRKRKPWNAGLKMPGLLDEPPTVVKATPAKVMATPSTGLEFSPRYDAKEKTQPKREPSEE